MRALAPPALGGLPGRLPTVALLLEGLDGLGWLGRVLLTLVVHLRWWLDQGRLLGRPLEPACWDQLFLDLVEESHDVQPHMLLVVSQQVLDHRPDRKRPDPFRQCATRVLGVVGREVLGVVVLQERPVGMDPLVEPRDTVQYGLVHDHRLLDALGQLGVEHGRQVVRLHEPLHPFRVGNGVCRLAELHGRCKVLGVGLHAVTDGPCHDRVAHGCTVVVALLQVQLVLARKRPACLQGHALVQRCFGCLVPGEVAHACDTLALLRTVTLYE